MNSSVRVVVVLQSQETSLSCGQFQPEVRGTSILLWCGLVEVLPFGRVKFFRLKSLIFCENLLGKKFCEVVFFFFKFVQYYSKPK